MDVRQRNGVSSTNNSSQQQQQPRSVPLSRINSSKMTTTKSHGNASNWTTSIGMGFVIAAFLLVLGVMTGTVSVKYHNQSTTTSDKQQPQQQFVRGIFDAGTRSIDDFQQKNELESLQKRKKELEDELMNMKKLVADNASHQSDTDATKAMEASQNRIKRFLKTTQRQKEMIQLISKRHLIEKYGMGPHYVEILLSIDPQSNIADSTKPSDDTEILVIEMAPITEMPATVYWFLEQVNATIYNGASFHRNAHHVVQGGVIANFESPSGDAKRIRELIRTTGLDSVPFQEYSPNFPHKKHTLGYAGRPGGPDFYVSTVDNTRNHGPGGQSSYEEAAEADPCFAKVVPGYERVVDRIHKSNVQPGDYNRMQHYVAIRQMRLLPPHEAPAITQLT